MMYREGPPQVQLHKMDSKGAIKISKDGLECDNTSGRNFETVKADVKVKGGKWYYEAKLLTYGKIHIGWCTDKCTIQTNSYTGLGHDTESWAYDGSYQVVWHGSSSNNTRYGEYWNNGDIIGCVLDLEAKQMSFYRNGKDLGVAFSSLSVGDGYYPAASLQYGQKIQFNFGKEPFKYPLSEVFPDIHPLHLNLTKEQQKQLEHIFEKYKNVGITMSESGETDDIIKGQGLLQYGQDLGITDEKDAGLLIVAWKLNARDKKVWEFSREAFVGGWALESCYSVDQMKKKLKGWRDELKQEAKFKSFYNFVFDYLREDKTVLTMEECITVWDMLGFNESRWPMMPKWLEFASQRKSLTRDTWRLFYSFTHQYPKDLSNFNADDCWPTLIDEFVELIQKGQKKK
jgi:hypothetical protein